MPSVKSGGHFIGKIEDRGIRDRVAKTSVKMAPLSWGVFAVFDVSANYRDLHM